MPKSNQCFGQHSGYSAGATPYLIFHLLLLLLLLLQMPCFHLRFSILHSPSNCIQQDLIWPRFGYLEEYRHFPLVRVLSNHDISVSRSWSSSISIITPLPRLNSLGAGAPHFSVDVSEMSDIGKCCQSMVSIDSSAEKILLEEVPIHRDDSLKILSIKDIKERQRREKIGLANKGRVPWNKGRKHSAETRERIKRRTIEALNNPKVRKKMAEHPRTHSDHIKEKIGSSLQRVWAKRLKWKRSREKFFHSWAESIAEAAKTGGPGQQALEWDSYDKIKRELVQKDVHLAEEKIKAKELATMIRAEKAAQAIAVRMEKLARKRKLREERIKQKEEKAKAKRKLNRDKKDSTRKLKLQQRLSQIRQKISPNGQVSSRRHIPALEKLDLECIKGESLQREVSFADQIKAAKHKKAEFAATEALQREVSFADQIKTRENKKADFVIIEALAASSLAHSFSRKS